ncbi:MAG: GNAT family N-acetyltransferase [Candidatus Eremiobacteraeota bacterium]|nr:GNAT family N-acetyltransferase [Candidatus Eremiobacteraeota bacterium]
MSYAIRRANADDAPLLAEHRARVWREVGGWDEESMAAQIPVWTAWFRDHVAEEIYVSFVAEEDGDAIASASLLVQRAIPRPELPSDREGRVQSVYVVPDARRRGIARALMDHLIDYARTAALVRLTLHPSDEARELYASMGFAPLDEMGLRLYQDDDDA